MSDILKDFDKAVEKQNKKDKEELKRSKEYNRSFPPSSSLNEEQKKDKKETQDRIKQLKKDLKETDYVNH
ncbi:unnamed protein product [Rhizophagus irregularis]|nr:unnamed protein product [Rhizophagus irregularis]